MKKGILNLRFRTRLVLAMFLITASTSVILMVAYIQHNRRIKAYVAGQTSDLVEIIALTQASIPAKADRTQALSKYLSSLKGAGLSSINVLSPTGEVVASTNPHQIGKKIKLRRRRSKTKEGPIQITAQLRDIDTDTQAGQQHYDIRFPIIQGEKVIGYVQVGGEMDEVGAMLNHVYFLWLVWILFTMLASMVAIVYLTFRFTKPIDLLVEGSNQVAQGNLYVSLPEGGTDEMGLLARTFNQMAGRLRDGRELQKRLNEAEKSSLLGHFASTVAHEVRNSLNFLNLSIDQIRARRWLTDETPGRELRGSLANMKDEITRLDRLVNDFLAVGRQTPPQIASCDLRATCEQAVSLVDKQAKAQDIKIVSNLPPDLPALQADAAQLKTCFLNILTNSVQAMPHGGSIRIEGKQLPDGNGGGRLQLQFCDTGPGIVEADREKIFAPYFSTKVTGFGLGLAITRKIIEDHGGRVYVSHQAVPGTEMVVELPLAGPAIPPTPALAGSRVV
ncbi:MAG TPA: ATP-binding protein [Terriglobia bacterium]|nr:ATP-binding protein [Terriglobia bacterium]